MNEFQRMVECSESMTYRELYQFLSYDRNGRRLPRANKFAEELGIIPSSRRSTTVSEIYRRLREPVVVEPEDEPEGNICDGCGGISKAEGLRWRKADNGEPVTISVDESGKPASLRWLTPFKILQDWFLPWSEVCSIRFRLVTDQRGDCHINFEPIDGPGSTLGFVWQPAEGAEFMEQAGDLSGDMTIDSSDRWVGTTLITNTGLHEGGHVIGIGHSKNPNDVMYGVASSRGLKTITQNDSLSAFRKYPIK